MALVNCGHCGLPLSDKAEFCPHSGRKHFRKPQSESSSNKIWIGIIGGVLLGLLTGTVAYVIFRTTKTPVHEFNTTVVKIDTIIEASTTSAPNKETVSVPTKIAPAIQQTPPAVPHFDGSYSLSGDIRGQYFFGMNLNISGKNVNGEYRVYNGYDKTVLLKGTIKADGKMTVYEYEPDGSQTGYYFTGTFSGGHYKGKYLCTQRRINMSFHAE